MHIEYAYKQNEYNKIQNKIKSNNYILKKKKEIQES